MHKSLHKVNFFAKLLLRSRSRVSVKKSTKPAQSIRSKCSLRTQIETTTCLGDTALFIYFFLYSYFYRISILNGSSSRKRVLSFPKRTMSSEAQLRMLSSPTQHAQKSSQVGRSLMAQRQNLLGGRHKFSMKFSDSTWTFKTCKVL